MGICRNPELDIHMQWIDVELLLCAFHFACKLLADVDEFADQPLCSCVFVGLGMGGLFTVFTMASLRPSSSW